MEIAYEKESILFFNSCYSYMLFFVFKIAIPDETESLFLPIKGFTFHYLKFVDWRKRNYYAKIFYTMLYLCNFFIWM